MARWVSACCEQRKRAEEDATRRRIKQRVSWGRLCSENRYLVSGKKCQLAALVPKKETKGVGKKRWKKREARQLWSQKEEAFPSYYLVRLKKLTEQELERGDRMNPQHWQGAAGRWRFISSNFMPNCTQVCVFLRRESTAFRCLSSWIIEFQEG